MSVKGTVDGKALAAYVERFPVPKPRGGQMMVMDNLSVHKSKRVERPIEEAETTLLLLAAYSPDFNPIEQIFSKAKGILRKAGPRTREALVEATGHALNEITSRDIRRSYSDCGHHLPVQPL